MGYLVPMGAQVVFENGRYNGRTLIEWVPDVVARIVERFDPLKIILFGSLARGEETRDSDIDLLVVLPHIEDKRRAAIDIRVAIGDLPVPVDVFPTDPEEIERRRDIVGTVIWPAVREGRVVHERGS